MSDLPDIIIRTAEEREAERQAEESFPWELAEARSASGTVMLHLAETFIPDDDYFETQTWRFKTEKAMLMFAAARIRELRQGGVKNIGAPYTQLHNEHPDKRRSPDSYDNPLGKRVRIPRSVPLEW